MVHDVWRSRKRPTKQRQHRCIITGSCIRSSWSNLRTIGDQSKLRVQCGRVRGQNNPQPRRINQHAEEDIKQSKLALCPRSNSRSEEHTSELQSLAYLVCRLLLEKKKTV